MIKREVNNSNRQLCKSYETKIMTASKSDNVPFHVMLYCLYTNILYPMN